MNRGRNLELRNETIQISTSVFISQIQYLSHFPEFLLFLQNETPESKNRRLLCKNENSPILTPEFSYK